MRRYITALLASILSLVLTAPAQDANQEAPLIKASVDVVQVLCAVRDKRGDYMSGLKREDFEIWEDGVRQSVDFFSSEMGKDAQPLTVAFLIDTSGSVKEKLRFEQDAAAEFLSQTLRKNKDMAAIVQFDSDINLVQDFTYDYEILEQAIFEIKAGGATKLYDAIWAAVEELLSKEVGQRVMIILSDGADTQSVVTDKEAIRVAQEEDVVIYGIGVRTGRFDSDFGRLKKFAAATGGMFFNSKADPSRLREAFMKINRAIKHQYSLGYVSTNREQNGSYRELKVRIKRPRLKVISRRGYYAAKGDS